MLIAGCSYGFRGGGGFPDHIRTVYIEPFQNQTAYFDVEQQIFQKLLERLPAALGVRPAGAEVADAVVTGRVIRYDDAAQNVRGGAGRGDFEVLAHNVQIAVAIEIVDRRRNVYLWRQGSIVGRGEYTPGTQTDVDGRSRAIEDLVQQIVNGAQSQW